MTESARAARLPSRALFEAWLEDMDPRLARFVDFLLPPSVVGDFSRESLVGVEARMLEQFPDPEVYYAGECDGDFIDGAVRYAGETYLRAFGGGWRFSDDPGFVLAGRPYLILGTPDATPISPFNLMGAALHRRTGRVLAKVYDGQARAIADRRAIDPAFTVEREAVPGIHVPAAAERRRRDAGAGYLKVWIEGMAPTLAQWRSELGAWSEGLDGTVDSLAALERVVLDRLPDAGSVDATGNEAFVAGATYYLGGVFRGGAGGEWCYLPGEPDPKLRLVGRPYLERRDADGDPRRSVPSLVLRSLVRKRIAGSMLRAYQAYAT